MDQDHSFSQALDEIGGASFAPKLLTHLSAAVGAEHCVLFRFDVDDLLVLGVASANGSNMASSNSARYRRDFWKRDATFQHMKGSLCGYQSEVSFVAAEQISDPEFRQELFLTQGLAGRAMLVGERSSGLYGVSLFRNHEAGFFTRDEREVIHSLADVLISCVAKHRDLINREIDREQSLITLFSSADQLESRFAAIPIGLSKRECEVCARILFGMSMKEIARDLGISADSGVTYRKRAYLRLGVASRSDLLRRLMQSLGSVDVSALATPGHPGLAVGPHQAVVKGLHRTRGLG